MSISNQFPDSRPAAIYNILNGRNELPSTATLVQAAVKTYVTQDGYIGEAPPNSPRFDYNPNTGELEGLLLDPAYSNWCAPSNTFVAHAGGSIAPNTPGTLAPNKAQTAVGVTKGAGSSTWQEGLSTYGVMSVFCKKAGNRYVYIGGGGAGFNNSTAGYIKWNPHVYDFDNDVWISNGTPNAPQTQIQVDKFADGWRRFWIGYQTRDYQGSAWSIDVMPDASGGIWNANNPDVDPTGTVYVWGAQYTKTPRLMSYIDNPTGVMETPLADDLSIGSDGSTNYNVGLSLLLDSVSYVETDFIYKVFDNASVEKVSLKNVNEVLEWEVDGVSLQTKDEFPQVAFITGRNRTVSSLGQASQGNQTNYLYTPALSFPLETPVPPNLSELKFGTPQILKAIYLWNRQLPDMQAVSVIKGEFNVVPPTPEDNSKMVIIYNTDPTNVNNRTANLAGVIPNVDCTVDWGDGTSESFTKGTPLTHDYPINGLYKIQLTAPGLWDQVQFYGPGQTDVIREVRSWQTPYKAGSADPGFIDDQLYNLMTWQSDCPSIPDFKYTGLTNLTYAFYRAETLAANGPNNTANWSWIPSNLPNATTLQAAFSFMSTGASQAEREVFPQLVTSGNLTSVQECFNGTNIRIWRDNLGNPTNLPWTDTSNVTNFLYALGNQYELTDIGRFDTSKGQDFSYMMYNNFALTEAGLPSPFWDMSSATNITSMFQSCNSIVNFPAVTFGPNCTNWTQLFYDCDGLTTIGNLNTNVATTMSSSFRLCGNLTTWNANNLAFDNCQIFTSCWRETGLTAFPAVDFPEAINMSATFYMCRDLASYGTMTFPKCTSMSYCFYQNSSLPVFPSGWDFSSVQEIYSTWEANTQWTTFPAIDFVELLDASRAWNQNRGLTSFPDFTAGMKFPKCTTFESTWYLCESLPSFPNMDIGSGTNFKTAWGYCSSMVTFNEPVGGRFNAGVTSFEGAWAGCTVLANMANNMFDDCDSLISTGFKQAFENCPALTPVAITRILTSLVTGGSQGVELGMSGTTPAPSVANWGQQGMDALEVLEAAVGTNVTNTTYTNQPGQGWTVVHN